MDIWLVGDGEINMVMLNTGLIDEMTLTLFPLVLGTASSSSAGHWADLILDGGL